MGSLIAIALAAAGIGISALGQYKQGKQQQKIGRINAKSISDIAEENAQLTEQEGEANAGIFDFNAKALELSAQDSVARGKEDELRFRKQLKSVIGTQKAAYAGQNVDLSYGSPVDVIADTASEGELDSIQIRVNAAREAWGFQTEAQSTRLQAKNLRKVTTLKAKNIRDVGETQAQNALLGGNAAASAGAYGAASTIAGGGGQLLLMKYGYK